MRGLSHYVMLIHFSFTVVLLLAGIIIGLWACVMLLAEKKNHVPNRFLVLLVLISVGTLLHNFFIESGIYREHNSLYFVPIIFSLGTGPLLYLYVKRLINLRSISAREICLHLLPVMIQFLLYLYCFLQNNDRKYQIYAVIYEPYAKSIQNIAVYISASLYLYAAFKEIKLYKTGLNNFYSNDQLLGLTWLRRLLYAFTFYYVLLIFFIVLANGFHFSVDYFPGDLIRCIIIFTIAFFAVKQNSLIEMQQNISSVDDRSSRKKIGEETTAPEIDMVSEIEITGEEAKQPSPVAKEVNLILLQQIVAVTEQEQLFLNEELTVADLAAKTGSTTRAVSQTINAGLGKSFARFINEYRVNLFKEKKASGKFDHLSIMGLAYDCGFNSKSAFNRIYKEITGSVPKETASE